MHDVCIVIYFYYQYFFLISALALFGQFFFIFLFAGLMAAGVDIMPLTMDQLPLDVRTDSDYLKSLAWLERDEETDIIDRSDANSGDIVAERTEVAPGGMIMYFQHEGGNVFTKENLEHIQEVENEYYNREEYKSSWCALDADNICYRPGSVIRFFDGSKRNISGIFDDRNFNNIVGVLNEAFTNPKTKRSMEEYMGKNARIEPGLAQSEITRVTIQFGIPIKGYNNASDDDDKQFEEMGNYMKDNWLSDLDKLYGKGVGQMNFYFLATQLIGAIIGQFIMMDLMLAMAGLVFVFIIVAIQTRSLWITSWAVFSILSSFFTAILVYRLVFDFRYVGIFHVLAIFIILGIGADDVFVFFDTWKHSGHYQFKSIAHRMSYTYRRAALAMLFTSLTTATAFMVSAASPFLAVNSFGVFAGLLILVNYMSVIVFLPCVVVTYHNWFSKFKCCCCCQRNELDEGPQKKNFVVRFFSGPYYQVITHKIIRWIIVAFCIALLIFFIVFATKVKLNEESVSIISNYIAIIIIYIDI